MKNNIELVDVGGAKQPEGINPKYKWEVLDVTGKAHKYTNYDFNSGLPFPMKNNSISAFYCSMALEHVHPSKIQHIINEMYNKLTKNGKVRIIVPDIEIGINWYLKNPDRLKQSDVPHMMDYYPKTKCGYLFSWINSYMDSEKNYGRTGHQMMFDYETLTWYLINANFKNIKRMKFNKCSEFFIGKDSPRYSQWGLYVEADK